MAVIERRAVLDEKIRLLGVEIVNARGAGRIYEAASRLAHSALEVARQNAGAGRWDKAEYSLRIAAASLEVTAR